MILYEQRFLLGWPSADLSPNSRLHWARLHRSKKAYRAACYLMTIGAALRPPPAEGDLLVHLVFRPPGGYRYDEDNLVTRMKAGLDGVADALGVNDHRFRLSHEIGEVDGPSGCVEVHITA